MERRTGAFVIVVALVVVLITGLAIVMSVNPQAPVHPAQTQFALASPSIQFQSATSTSGGTINGSTILSDIWGAFSTFFNAILTDITTLINEILVQSLGASFVTIFTNWGYSVSNGYGIWAPLIAILVLALSGYALYAFMDLYGIERDILHGEEDI